MTCSSCKFAWFGAAIPKGHGSGRSQWHCRKQGKPLATIGGDKELALAKGCKDWVAR